MILFGSRLAGRTFVVHVDQPLGGKRK